ncbi:hypothetical protein G210_1526 [Candida maltosa Xu316]|uniref:Uncharacterized protein n=1 Tax=Candida maltosa (strain Xu316) TaxID=1245528 RepID=M3JYD4_CANMX|nr:hypothetical protein G210_1526 [Candida maltosa Xu316]
MNPSTFDDIVLENPFSDDDQTSNLATAISNPLSERSSDSSSSSTPPPTTSSVLYEATHHKFNRTKNGKIFEKDLKDIFSLLIISLKLKRDSSLNIISTPLIKISNPLSKKYPFSFSLDEAMESMKKMDLSIESTNTITHISYNFKPDISLLLVTQFFKARLLHSPADRTRNEPKSNVVLQPTPKGLAIVQQFCERVGLPKADFPEILLANDFNTMELFKFDRDLNTDKILYSEYFLHLLFNTMMGPKPNVWTPSNKPDSVLPKALLENEKFDNLNYSDKIPETGFSFSKFQDPGTGKNKNGTSSTSSHKSTIISPFHHRYFTNPESDSHTQYYVSSVGVRLLKNKEILINPDKSITVDYCISGKAICQWIIDCTDIMNPKQSSEIASLFLKVGLIKHVIESNNDFSRNDYYQITTFGQSISQWNISNDAKTNAEEVAEKNNLNLTLEDVLSDPGMKFQFRKHLARDFCVENLESFTQLKQFDKKYRIWKNLKQFSKDNAQYHGSVNIDQRLDELQKSCMSIAYQIYNTYLSNDAPYVVNIDFKLRSKIIALMTSQEHDSADDESMKYLQTPTEEHGSSLMFSNDFEPPAETKELTLEEEMQLQEDNLAEIANLLGQIRNQIYRLMEKDSIPKFLDMLAFGNVTFVKKSKNIVV